MSKRKVYNAARAKGEVHQLLRERGPRFSISKDKSKEIARKAKHKNAWKSEF